MRSVSLGLLLGGVVALSAASVGCSSGAGTNPWEEPDAAHDGAAVSEGDDGAANSGDSGSGSEHDGAAGGHDGGSGAHDGGAADSGESKDSSSGAADTGAGVDAGQVTSDDGFGPSRTACINKINALRATNTAVKLSPYTLYNTDTTNTCVDTQASTDQSKNSAHYAFINNDPSCQWGKASGWAQDECEQGYGTTPAGIEQCMQDMWDESLKPNCAGCVGCTTFGGACPNCDYSGTKGYECGHYVNMSAPYFTMVACGFAGAAPSSGSAWSVQNFE